MIPKPFLIDGDLWLTCLQSIISYRGGIEGTTKNAIHLILKKSSGYQCVLSFELESL